MNMFTVVPISEKTSKDYFSFFEDPASGIPSNFVYYSSHWQISEEDLESQCKDAQKGIDLRTSSRAATENLLAEGTLSGFLLYCDGKPVGFCGAGKKENYIFLGRDLTDEERTSDGKTFSIVDLLIYPAYRRKGGATLLLSEVLKGAASNGCSTIEIYPHRSLISKESDYIGYLSFLETNGFTASADGKVYYKTI